MSRLTKNISDKQTYCGYEVKDCKYQQIYGLKKYSELENYVDCDLTLAIDKLGQLEDLEEQLGCPLEVIFNAIHNGVWVNNNEQGFHYISLINYTCEVSKIKNKLVPIYSFHVWSGNSEDEDDTIYFLEDYKKTWWLKKDKSE